MREIIIEQNEIQFYSEEKLEEIKPLGEKFQEFLSEGEELEDYLPYDHQGITFEELLDNNQVMLTAGTSAGKTAGQSIPLFYKLADNQIDKILLMYPTRALLRDQQQTLLELAKVYGLENEIAEIKGGMSRSELISELNKRIIIATPDSIYWFFNKNIKYSSLLIYALSQVDEVVIDEAHLFTGLVLNNLIFLINRMKKLARKLGKEQRYHILTATANQQLKKIYETEEVTEITGNSNCGNIKLQLKDKKDRVSRKYFKESLSEFIDEGEEESCVTILNSAKVAHQLFYGNTEELAFEEVPKEIKANFSYSETKLSSAEFLARVPNDKEEQIKEKLKDNLPQLLASISLQDYLETTQDDQGIRFENEKLFALISDYLEEGYNRFQRIIEQAEQEAGDSITNLEEMIARDEYAEEFCQGIKLRQEISPYDSLAEVKGKLEDKLNNFKQVIETNMDRNEKFVFKCVTNNDNFHVETKEISLKKESQNSEEIYFNYSPKLKAKLANELTLNDLEEEDWNEDDITLFEKVKEIEVETEVFAEMLGNDFNANWLETTNIPRYLAQWKGNSNILVILYTGSMPNYLREGLVETFNEVDYEKKILLATSAVEVGVDFEADFLITEETNAASFLQRFGRIGRNGQEGRVKLFLTSSTIGELNENLKENRIKRDQFSAVVNDVFDQIKGINSEEFLSAYHWIVNKNLGRIGRELNTEFSKSAEKLGEKLRKKVELNYGLRGTMPSVALRGGVTKNPFYILRFLNNGDLQDTTSPFEVAQTDKSFDSLIWDSYAESEDVYVDIDKTLNYSKLMFTKQDQEDQFIPYFREGICARYEREFLRKEQQFSNNKEKFLAGGEVRDKWKEELKIYDQGMLEYLLLSDGHKYILGFGDIYLKKDTGPIFVEDKRLVLPNQFFLLLVERDLAEDDSEKNTYINLLQRKGIFEYEEVIVDDTDYNNELNDEHKARNPLGIVMLETINGALFEVYNQLLAATKAGEL